MNLNKRVYLNSERRLQARRLRLRSPRAVAEKGTRAPALRAYRVPVQAGTSLGPYVVGRELGSGGMGAVYVATVRPGDSDDGAAAATGLEPGTVVALKVVHERLLGEDASRRFAREVEIGRRVRHPNVVRTLDGGEAGGRLYLAMEYVEGQTLAALRQELERVPEELCRHIGREVCKGLASIHSEGAIHRDVKPENVIISLDAGGAAGSPDSRQPVHVVKIMDLGVARSVDDAARLSHTGAFVGSLHYAAPEQFKGGGKGLDGRTDLHALGLVLYELASGVAPYHAPTVSQTLTRVLHEQPRRLGELNPQLSAFYEEVVHCLLAKDPADRFATAGELHDVLEQGEDSPWWRAHARAMQAATRRPIRRIRIPRETAVYGRDKELAALRACWERAKEGTGAVVLIEGEAGIGKSRLVDELVGRLHASGEDVRFVFGGYPPGGAATSDGGFSSAYREQFGEGGSAPYLQSNPALVPAFDALLRGEGAPPGAQSLNKGSLQTCFVRATHALAKERPTIVLIDDLHFAPEEGRALFTALATAVPEHRVLLVGTLRPGVPEEWLAGLTRAAHVERIALARLGAKDLVDLLRDAFRSEQLAEQLGVKIAAKSDGNPFFAFEIVQGLRDGALIRRAQDGRWESTQVIEDIEIPSSVLDLVNARVASLAPDDRDVLDVAACCGFEFDPGLLADVLGTGRIPLLKRLAQVERAHRLVRAKGRAFVFDHHQVQEALYASLPQMLREEYHGALAEAIERRAGAGGVSGEEALSLGGALCLDLCDHWLRAGRGDDALRYLGAACAHLGATHAQEQTADLTGRVLAVPGLLSGTKRVRVLLRRVGCMDRLGRREPQREAIDQALALLEEMDEPRLLADALRCSGQLFIETSYYDEALGQAERAVEVAREAGDLVSESIAHDCCATALLRSGRVEEGRAAYERALELAERAGHAGAVLGAMNGVAISLLSEGRHDEGRAWLERTLERAIAENVVVYQAIVTGNLGFVEIGRGRSAAALEHTESGIRFARTAGFVRAEMQGHTVIAGVFEMLGDAARSREHAERAARLARETGARETLALANLCMARLLLREGRSAEARELGEAVVGNAPSDAVASRAHDLLGQVAVVEGGLDEARDRLSRAREAAPDEACARLACAIAAQPGAGQDAIDDARRALEADLPRIPQSVAAVAQFRLWLATGERALLDAAHETLVRLRDHAPVEYRDSMIRDVPVYAEIAAAWAAEL